MGLKTSTKTFSFQVYSKQTYFGGCLPPVINLSTWTYPATASRSGGSNPRFKYQIRNCLDATTPLSGVDYEVKKFRSFKGAVARKPKGSMVCTLEREYMVQGIFGFPTDPNTESASEAEAASKNKCVQKIRQSFSDFAGSTVMAEIRDTLGMIRRPLRGLRNGLDNYHKQATKLARSKPRRLRDRLSELWLEHQFGWQPLNNDIDGAMKNLAKLNHDTVTKFRADVRLKGRHPAVYEVAIGSNLRITATVREESEHIVRYIGALRIPVKRDLSFQSWGFGTQDFLPAVWEAIPYSFLVDYFSNLGNIIDSYSYVPGNVAWLCKTVRKERKKEIKGYRVTVNSGFAPNASYELSETSVENGYLDTRVRRVFRSSVPASDLIQTLELRNPFPNTLRELNLLALANLRVLR